MGRCCMFGFFKKNTKTNVSNNAGGLQSFHYSAAKNKMVPCESTPCRIHGDNDILAADAYDATIKLNAKINAYNAYKQKQVKNQGMGMQAGANNGNANNNASTLNPNKITPDDYDKVDLFKDNEYAKLVSFNTIYVGNLRYAPAVKKLYFNDDAYSDYTVNFAKRCEYCHGTGSVNDEMCTLCGGQKYSAKCSASPADMVLIQDVKGADDRKFHDFVKQYPDDFNEYMRHVIIANTYLANDGEKALYSQELKKNFKNEVVNDQNAFLRNIRSLKYHYDERMKGANANTINSSNIMVAGSLNIGRKIVNRRVTILSTHVYNDKKTGEKKVVLYCEETDKASGTNRYKGYKLFASYNKNCIPGNRVYISSAYISAYDPDDAGRPYLKLRNAKVSIYNKGEI